MLVGAVRELNLRVGKSWVMGFVVVVVRAEPARGRELGHGVCGMVVWCGWW